MALIGAIKVPVASVKMTDKDIGKILWCGIFGLKSVDVLVCNEPAVEIQELIQLLIHQQYVPGFYDPPEIPYY